MEVQGPTLRRLRPPCREPPARRTPGCALPAGGWVAPCESSGITACVIAAHLFQSLHILHNRSGHTEETLKEYRESAEQLGLFEKVEFFAYKEWGKVEIPESALSALACSLFSPAGLRAAVKRIGGKPATCLMLYDLIGNYFAAVDNVTGRQQPDLLWKVS